MRGDVHVLKPLRNASGHEQQGRRYGVVVQSDALPLSTVLIAPTSTRSQFTSFRVEVEILGRHTMVMLEQTRAMDATRLGDVVGRLSLADMQDVDRALKTVLDLR